MIGVLTFFFGKPVYLKAKDIRATQLADQALEHYLASPTDSTVVRQSVDKAKSAILLSPTNAAANRTLATLTLFSNPVISLKYWDQAIALQDSFESFSDLDKMHYVQTLILNRELQRAKEVLLSFDVDSPSYADALYNLVKVCYLSGDKEQAFEYGREMIRNRNTPIQRHLFFASMCLSSPDESIRKEGEKHVKFLLGNDDLVDDSVLWQMTQLTNLSEGLRDKLDKALNRRITVFEERVQLVDYRIANKLVTPEEGLNELAGSLDRDDQLALVRLALWCSKHGFPDEAVDLMSVDLATKRKDWFVMYIKNLGVLGQWEKIINILTTEDCPIEEFLLDVLKCEAYSENGDQIKAINQWYRAKIASDPVINDLWLLIRIGDKMELEEETEKLLRELVIIGENPEKVVAYVAQRELAKSDYESFYRQLTGFKELYSNIGSIVNDWAYFSVLLDKNVDEAMEVVDKLVERDPKQLRYHMTWALGQIKQRHYREVLARFQQFDIDWMALHPKYRFILALALAGVGEYEQGEAYLEGIEKESYNPYELELYEKHFYYRKN